MVRADRASTAGWIHHVGFTVSDLDVSVAFYQEVVGLDLVAVNPQPRGGHWFDSLTGSSGALIKTAMLARGDTRLQLIEYVHGAAPRAAIRHAAPGSPHLSLRIADVWAKHAALSVVAELDAGPVVELVPVGRSFYVRDPDGVYVEFVELPPHGG